MKNVICSSCGIRVQIPARSAAFVGPDTICPSCLYKRSQATSMIKKAERPLSKSQRWGWLKRPWRRNKATS